MSLSTPRLVQGLSFLAMFAGCRFHTVTGSNVMENSVMPDGAQLLLPEVPSRLNFEQIEGFASENDTRAQTELRNSRFWGRMYLEGWPQPIQYFVSHFSGPPDMAPRPLVLADPPMGCGPLANAAEIRNTSAVVLVRRGECTFGTKARHVVHAGGSAVVYINDREGIQHASGPDAHDLDVCAVMIAQAEGDMLWALLGGEQQQACTRAPNVRLIPMHCSAANEAFRTQHLCEAVTGDEREYIRSRVIEGGLIQGLEGGDVEYLLAHFGSWVPTEPLRLMGPPSDNVGCGPWPAEVDVRGAAVLLDRGNCSYLDKALHAQAAGARVVMVANDEQALLRAGTEPRSAGLNVTSSVVTVTRTARDRLVKLLSGSTSDVFISLAENENVRSEMWDELRNLLDKKQWPRHPKRAKEAYYKLVERVKGWPERTAALEAGFAKLNVRL